MSVGVSMSTFARIVLDRLATLPDESVHCVVTTPPMGAATPIAETER